MKVRKGLDKHCYISSITKDIPIPERKKVLQTARKEFQDRLRVYNKLQEMARIQGEGNESEENFIRFANHVINESASYTVGTLTEFLKKCVTKKLGVYSVLKLSEVNYAAQEIIIINERVAEQLRREIKTIRLEKSLLDPDSELYKDCDKLESILRTHYYPYSMTARKLNTRI